MKAVAVKERPILFSAPMIRAILDNKKTQTRRVITPQPTGNGPLERAMAPGIGSMRGEYAWQDKDRMDVRQCPFGGVGTILWVRETWTRTGAGVTQYRADSKTDQPYWGLLKWRPSIFMPRWASRITLEVVSVRVERLQEISVEDIEAEGLMDDAPVTRRFDNLRRKWRDGWDSLNAKRGYCWGKNPWVWVIEFKRLQ